MKGRPEHLLVLACSLALDFARNLIHPLLICSSYNAYEYVLLNVDYFQAYRLLLFGDSLEGWIDL